MRKTLGVAISSLLIVGGFAAIGMTSASAEGDTTPTGEHVLSPGGILKRGGERSDFLDANADESVVINPEHKYVQCYPMGYCSFVE